jgi:hypothetical protein
MFGTKGKGTPPARHIFCPSFEWVMRSGARFHAPSVAEATRHALAHGLADRVSFKEASAKDIKDPASTS